MDFLLVSKVLPSDLDSNVKPTSKNYNIGQFSNGR